MDKQLEKKMTELLNNIYVLSIHTQLAHWFIRGPHFPSWHELLGSHYATYSGMIDDLAERMIMHQGKIGKSINELISLNREMPIDTTSPENTIAHLIKLVSDTIEQSINTTIIATNLNEFVIADLIIDITNKLEKVNWYYKSIRS